MMKKFFAFILAACMLLIPLVSCSDSADVNGNVADTAEGTGDTAAAVETEEEEEALGIPDADYKEYVFTILCHSDVSYNYGTTDWDEPSDDVREQALYERGLAVEDLLNVTIDMYQTNIGGDVYSIFKTDTDSGLYTYDIVFNSTDYQCTAVTNGYCYNIDEIEYIDLDKSWWNADCTEQLSIGGNHYMVSGDIAVSDKECTWVVYFLKDLLTAVGITESPYDLVKSGEWTWDKLYSMAAKAAFDTNGDGTLDTSDRYGLTTHGESYAASWQSAGLKFVTTDSDGMPQISWGTDTFVEVYEKINDILTDSDIVYCINDSFAQSALLSEQTLFMAMDISFASTYRNSEYVFGIVPYPKYSEDIDRYYSYMTLSSCTMIVPITCSNTERTGIITEALAYYGQKYITPAYYDVQLKARYSRDEESQEMLDIIFTYRAYDLGVFFNWGGAYSSLVAGDASPATLYASLQKAMSKSIEKSLSGLS
ncbi:MAG: extracellular solute-binding protein [Clostridiales bacterium]|nr:extracellular solute-binding protein [Clostridiales bacterium]